LILSGDKLKPLNSNNNEAALKLRSSGVAGVQESEFGVPAGFCNS
jgi:hypothetical protein